MTWMQMTWASWASWSVWCNRDVGSGNNQSWSIKLESWFCNRKLYGIGVLSSSRLGFSDVVFGVVQSNVGALIRSTWNRVKGYAIP